MKSIFQRSVFLLLAAAAGSLLVACNNENPYGGDIKGPEHYVPTTNPLDDDAISTQIALYIDKPIKNLSYECHNANNSVTRSRMEYLSEQSVNSLGGLGLAAQVPVARCGNEALSISFYLGNRTSVSTKSSVYLGTATLPTITAIGADGKNRFAQIDEISGYEKSNSPFLFNFSVADLHAPPSRVGVHNAFNQSGQCASGKEDACQVVLKTALLLALDKNANDPNAAVIEIDQEVNEAIAKVSWDAEDVEQDFKKQSYSDFVGDGITKGWEKFIGTIDPDNSSYHFDPDATATIKRIQAGASRLRAGTYGFDYMGEQLNIYSSYFLESAQLKKWKTERAIFTTSMLVYPDGTITGFGIAADTFCTNINTNSLGQAMLDAITCALFELSEKNLLVVANQSGSQKPAIADNLTLDQLNIRSLNTTPDVNVNVTGRLLTQRTYDGRTPDTMPDNDFKLEYPTALYQQKTAEKGSVTGQFFGFNLPDFINDAIGSVPGSEPGSMEPAPFPLTLEKQSDIQVDIKESVLAQLQDSVYRIQLMHLCDFGQSPDTDSHCEPIPAGEIDEEDDDGTNGSLNYPYSACLRQASNSDDCEDELKSEDVGETPRPVFVNDTAAKDYVDVKFVRDSTNGLVLTLYDSDQCADIADSSGDAVRVGYVIATPSDTSAVISVQFASNNFQWLSNMPNFGTETMGRIDLSEAGWPIYRSGEANFDAKVRAFWGDTLGYQRLKYIKSLKAANQSISKVDDLTTVQRGKVFTMSSGAVKGQKLNVCP